MEASWAGVHNLKEIMNIVTKLSGKMNSDRFFTDTDTVSPTEDRS